LKGKDKGIFDFFIAKSVKFLGAVSRFSLQSFVPYSHKRISTAIGAIAAARAFFVWQQPECEIWRRSNQNKIWVDYKDAMP